MTVTQPKEDPSRFGRAVAALTKLANSKTEHRTNATPSAPAVNPLTIEDDFVTPTSLVDENDFAMRITGIGGTGVVTVSQVLGTAAMLDGYHVRGLDQIGISQKAGPVVSDIRLSKSRAAYTNRLGEGQAALLLAFDQLVAASEKGELTSNDDTTYVVGSTSAVPTAAMILEPSLEMPSPNALGSRISEQTLPGHHWADAQQIVTGLFGSTTTANIFVVGMAVQAGVLPISPEHLEGAITLNGAAVDMNIAAFRWGRRQIIDPDAVARAASLVEEVQAAPENFSDRLDQLGVSGSRREHLSLLAGELSEWGTDATAKRWFDTLDQVVAAERKVHNADTLLDAVADGLFKLTAYKDEYEVARLMLLDEGLHVANELAGSTGTVAWKLHPPMLRALGIERKISIPTSATPLIRKLAQGKRLRGTPFDVFGKAEVRRVEQELADEYRKAVIKSLRTLSTNTLDDAVALAKLPDIVRGYEDIKLNNVEQYRRELAKFN